MLGYSPALLGAGVGPPPPPPSEATAPYASAGAHVPGYWLPLLWAEGTAPPPPQEDVAGRYTLILDPPNATQTPATYTFTVSAAGFAPKTFSRQLQNGDVVEVVVNLDYQRQSAGARSAMWRWRRWPWQA